ncbi:hypothetical protein OEZ85_007456 [Tetradesmus obliquus]|uniref:Apple domain-containing protein n=1 Tax=Tetradesmus obliquus TaxID=3088 RepID=A0ABY8TGG7_TETOB|nr:hypothetical protein OEZ85_007456 [Tetradesmus obliquus]
MSVAAGASPAPVYRRFLDYDSYGSDMSSARTCATERCCAKACDAKAACVAYVWAYEPPTAAVTGVDGSVYYHYCWLKASASPRSLASGGSWATKGLLVGLKGVKKHGNDGSASCSTYCKGFLNGKLQWPPRYDMCISGTDTIARKVIGCSKVRGKVYNGPESITLTTERAANVYIGSVIAGDMTASGASSESASCGLLARKVISIDQAADGNTVLTTEPATLLDVLLEAHIGADEAAAAASDSSSNAKVQLQRSAQTQRAATGYGKLGFEIPSPWPLEASIEGQVQVKPIMDLSVDGFFTLDITHPEGWAAARILLLHPSKRLQRAVASAGITITAGLDLKANLVGAIESKISFTDDIGAKPVAWFPCLPPPLIALTCTVGLKPDAEFKMSAELDASVKASFRTTVTAKQSMLAGYDMLRGGGFMDFPSRELVPGETTKDFQTTGCGASINMDMSGGLGLVFSWLVPSKFTDMFMVTVPYLEWKHPFKLEVSPTPFTTQQGRQCNMCNAACPRAKFSLVPTINWGAKIGLAGFVKTAVEKLPGNPAPEAKLMWSETLDYGVNGLCWDIPALKAVQPACCGASSVINSPDTCKSTPQLTANDDFFEVKEGATATFNPLANDTIPPGTTALVSSLGLPEHGTAQIVDNGLRVSYTSTATGFTSDAFTVTIHDSSGASATSKAHASIRASGPGVNKLYTWVSPITDTTGVRLGCDKSCENLGKEQGWRHVNGGSDDWALCAGLFDIPGVGQQWLPGRTLYSQATCIITCATTPCFLLPDGHTTSGYLDDVFGSIPYELNSGGPAWFNPPLKCACTTCNGDVMDCMRLAWTPAADAWLCPKPSIAPQPGESNPSTVYSSICLDNTMAGLMGWEDAKQKMCIGSALSATNYSVWCPNSGGVPV